jgi:hypothetical protein
MLGIFRCNMPAFTNPFPLPSLLSNKQNTCTPLVFARNQLPSPWPLRQTWHRAQLRLSPLFFSVSLASQLASLPSGKATGSAHCGMTIVVSSMLNRSARAVCIVNIASCCSITRKSLPIVCFYRVWTRSTIAQRYPWFLRKPN